MHSDSEPKTDEPEPEPEPIKKYNKDELPWNLKLVMLQPTVPQVSIFSGKDHGHAVKKNRNNVRWSELEGEST